MRVRCVRQHFYVFVRPLFFSPRPGRVWNINPVPPPPAATPLYFTVYIRAEFELCVTTTRYRYVVERNARARVYDMTRHYETLVRKVGILCASVRHEIRYYNKHCRDSLCFRRTHTVIRPSVVSTWLGRFYVHILHALRELVVISQNILLAKRGKKLIAVILGSSLSRHFLFIFFFLYIF